MAKEEKKAEQKPAENEKTVKIQATATEATADGAVAVPSIEKAPESVQAISPGRKKKRFTVGSKTEVKQLTSALSDVLPEGSHVTVQLPILEYNAFVDDAAKLIEDREYSQIRANNSGEALNTTIEENGITLHVRGVFA